MKTSICLSLLLAYFVGYSNPNNDSVIEFKVFGNCGMCEKRIENAALSLNGVLKATWNDKTNVIEVVYNDSIVKTREIHIAIAESGHDTDLFFSHEDIYNSLPVCCRYDRPAEIIYGRNRIVSVPPGCNPKKSSPYNLTCCDKNELK